MSSAFLLTKDDMQVHISRTVFEEYGELSVKDVSWMSTCCSQGERRIRGTAIYPTASSINHECLPNVARMDDFDNKSSLFPMNTAVGHAVPLLILYIQQRLVHCLADLHAS